MMDTDRLNAEHAFTFRVLRQEQVIVPAGVFDTLRVEGATKYKAKLKKDGSSGQGTNTFRFWFSPVAENVVALEFEETNWKGIVSRKERLELLSYNRSGKK